MAKQNGWETRLAEVVERDRSKPFKWGEHDCLTFADNAIEAQTGSSLFGDVMGGYTSASTARVEAKKHGDPISVIDARLERIGYRFLQRGDLVARSTGRRGALKHILGVKVDPFRIAFLALGGISLHDPLPTDLCWRVA